MPTWLIVLVALLGGGLAAVFASRQRLDLRDSAGWVVFTLVNTFVILALPFAGSGCVPEADNAVVVAGVALNRGALVIAALAVVLALAATAANKPKLDEAASNSTRVLTAATAFCAAAALTGMLASEPWSRCF